MAKNPTNGKTNKEIIRESDLSLLDNEAELNKKIDRWLEDSEPLFNEKRKNWKEAEKWFAGSQWKNEKQEYQSDTTINRIFPAIRNMVGMATDQRPKADILPAPADPDDIVEFDAGEVDPQTGQPVKSQISKSDINKMKAEKLRFLFDQRWEELHMSDTVNKSLYHTFIYDDAFWMPFWNYRDNDFDLELMRPEDVRVDDSGTDVDSARFVIFRPYKNRKWIEENYPEKLNQVKFGEDSQDKESKDRIRIDDTWTDYVRVIRAGKVILETMANPYFEFRTDEEQLEAWTQAGNDKKDFRPIRNYFRNPKKPLIMIPVCNIGKIYSESLMKQLIPVQKTLDKRKQQIDENANQMANGQWIYDVNFLDKEEAAALTNEPGLQIGIDGIEHIRKEAGIEMPGYVMQDLLHSQDTFDNIMGHHDISRGAKSKTQTATESSILSENDRVSIRSLVRNYEAALLDLYGWWLQMISLFYTEEKYIRVLGTNGAANYLSVTRFDVDDGVNIRIRPGSTLPQDRASIRQDAVQLSQLNMVDPLTLFELLDFPDPKKSVQRLMAWRQGFFPDATPQEIQQATQGNGAPPPNVRQYINFKDLPPEGQQQMAANVGIQLNQMQGREMSPEVMSQLDAALRAQGMPGGMAPA